MILSTSYLLIHLVLTTVLRGSYFSYHPHRWRKWHTSKIRSPAQGHTAVANLRFELRPCRSRDNTFNHYASHSHTRYPVTKTAHTGTSFITFPFTSILNSLVFIKSIPFLSDTVFHFCKSTQNSSIILQHRENKVTISLYDLTLPCSSHFTPSHFPLETGCSTASHSFWICACPTDFLMLSSCLICPPVF